MSNWKLPTDRQIRQRGIFFAAFAILMGFLLLPGAKEARSPFLYVIIFGGIFVAMPAVIGIALISGRLGRRK
jgi:hypothetical protein